MEFIERNATSDKAAWLEKRKNYVTGTDAAQLLGISPFGSKFNVWLAKTGQGTPLEQPAALRAEVGMVVCTEKEVCNAVLF